MAVTRITTWADDTEQAVYTDACRLTSVIIHHNVAQSAAAYLQLFDIAVGGGVVPGTTIPSLAMAINTKAISGKCKTKIVFPGGYRFATACTAFLATAAGGNTAPLTTVLPDAIDFFFEPGY